MAYLLAHFFRFNVDVFANKMSLVGSLYIDYVKLLLHHITNIIVIGTTVFETCILNRINIEPLLRYVGLFDNKITIFQLIILTMGLNKMSPKYQISFQRPAE